MGDHGGQLHPARCVAWQGPDGPDREQSGRGVTKKWADYYRAKIAAVGGQVSGFLHNKIAPQLKPGDDVLYVGDQDYSGNQIEQRTRKVLEELIGGELAWQRIALTEDQVK